MPTQLTGPRSPGQHLSAQDPSPGPSLFGNGQNTSRSDASTHRSPPSSHSTDRGESHSRIALRLVVERRKPNPVFVKRRNGRHDSLPESGEDISGQAAGGGGPRAQSGRRSRRLFRPARLQRGRKDDNSRDRRRPSRTDLRRGGSPRHAMGSRRGGPPPSHRRFATGNSPRR
jgi:hypothetical protein